ncbi:MAG: Gfo/Idh/MocA family oxidoreductase [Pyrinomonadaceae bacterium]|nr:Gfo/Idh/MocA family oxidoreductase [Pyrinomonadaceae bacterium]
MSWGILGTAKIALSKVIPAMMAGEFSRVTAISSRDSAKAQTAAEGLNIEKFYGSYEDLLNDREIDAVYIPLPNHLHFKWTKKAVEAGKHVLCEKPVAMNAAEVRELIGIRDKAGLLIQEAFMVRTHPTWLSVKQLVDSGRIGELKSITGFFSYFNDDQGNIRNNLEKGGGALLDIGCYCINLSRFMFEGEPDRVSAMIRKDPDMGVDVHTSAMLDFASRQATFTVSTLLVPYQRMQFFGTSGRIEVQIPFNIPVDSPTCIFIDDGSELYGEHIESIEFESSDQYTIQGDLFSQSILGGFDPAITLEDSFGNMAVIDAVFRSAETGRWETPVRI